MISNRTDRQKIEADNNNKLTWHVRTTVVERKNFSIIISGGCICFLSTLVLLECKRKVRDAWRVTYSTYIRDILHVERTFRNVEKSMYEFVRRLIQCLKGRVLIVVLLDVSNNFMWNSGREEKSAFNISVWTRTSSLEIGVKTGFDIIKYCRKLTGYQRELSKIFRLGLSNSEFNPPLLLLLLILNIT